MSPYSPDLSFVASPPIALERKIRSPQTIGLESPSPGIGICHRMFSPLARSQVAGKGNPSATPPASDPRKDGQSTPGLDLFPAQQSEHPIRIHTANLWGRTKINLPNRAVTAEKGLRIAL